jgi:hypothetical protein
MKIEIDDNDTLALAGGKVTIQFNGTLTAGKFQANPDGSLCLGEALEIDANGIMLLNGAEFRIQSGYNLVFEGGGPVLASPGGKQFKIVVNDEGVVSTVPITE